MNQDSIVEAHKEACNEVASGASWFYWIAGLSVLNSIIAAFGADWGFVFGLGATRLVDIFGQVIVQETGMSIYSYIAIAVNLVIAASFMFIGFLASKRSRVSFVIGFVLFAVDGILFFFVQDYKGIIFHLFVLYKIFKGFQAIKDVELFEEHVSTSTNDPVGEIILEKTSDM